MRSGEWTAAPNRGQCALAACNAKIRDGEGDIGSVELRELTPVIFAESQEGLLVTDV